MNPFALTTEENARAAVPVEGGNCGEGVVAGLALVQADASTMRA